MTNTAHEGLAVSFSRDVYRSIDRPPLPEGWNIHYDCPVEYQKDGYFGAAYRYVGPYGVEIYIAHRGTDNLSGLIEDAEMKLFDKIPQQFYDGAIPFIQKVFEKLDQDYPYIDQYNTTFVYIFFTGHSLGATLSELSIMRYVNYFKQGDNFNTFRHMQYPTDVFDSPGSADLVAQQLERGEISQQDFLDGSEYISVWNSDVDAINTCMQTSSSGYIASTMSRNYSSLTNESKLPYNPGISYYFNEYSVKDQHSIVHIYNWMMEDDRFYDYDKDYWPIGFNASYSFYKTYFSHYFFGFDNHNDYWDQYTSVYWDQNPQIHDQYDNRLYDFQQYYYRNVCYYFDGFSLSKEIVYKMDASDLQRIARFLSIDKERMHSSDVANKNKEKSNTRLCCGFGFFKVVENAQQDITSAADTVGKIVTETGETLSQVVSTANSTYHQERQMFFAQVDEFVNGGVSGLSPSSKNHMVLGSKK